MGGRGSAQAGGEGAGNFEAGYFEWPTPEQIERQLATTLLGPMNVTRAVLPVMRKQRSGHVVSISSSAGFNGRRVRLRLRHIEVRPRGLDGVAPPEVAPFGIHTTIVNPGSSASSCSPRSRPATPRRRSTTTPNAAPPSVSAGGQERQAGRRPGQARPGAADHRERGAAAAPLHRRRRLICKAEPKLAELPAARSTPSATSRPRWLLDERR